MRESANDLERLQRLLADSASRASPFLRSSFQLPVIAHGRVEIIEAEHPVFDELDRTQVALGRQSPSEWQGRAVYLHLVSTALFTYAAL